MSLTTGKPGDVISAAFDRRQGLCLVLAKNGAPTAEDNATRNLISTQYYVGIEKLITEVGRRFSGGAPYRWVNDTFVGTGEGIFTLRDVQDSISSVSGCSLSPETLEKLGREDILQCPAIGGSRILFNRAFTSKFILFSISIHPAKHPTRHNSLGVVNEVAKAARHGFMRTMTYLRHSG